MKTLFKLHIYFLIALLLVQFIPNQTMANELNSSTDADPLEVVLSSEDPELPIELFEDASEEIVLTTIEEGTTVEFLEEEETFSLILYTEENTEEEAVEWTGYVLTSNVVFPIEQDAIDADPATEEAAEGASEDDSYIVNQDEVVAAEEETAVVEEETTELQEEIQVDAEEVPAEGETSVIEEEPATEEKDIIEEEAAVEEEAVVTEEEAVVEEEVAAEEAAVEEEAVVEEIEVLEKQEVETEKEEPMQMQSFSMFSAAAAITPTFQGIAQQDRTHVYSQMNPNSPALKSYNKGTILRFQSHEPNWYKATVFNGGVAQTGYIHVNDVDLLINDPVNMTGFAKVDSLKVHGTPSRDSNVLKSYGKGSSLIFTSYSTQWHKATVVVRGTAQTGYIHVSDIDAVIPGQRLTGYAGVEPLHVYSTTSRNSAVLRSYSEGHSLIFRTFNTQWYEATVHVNGVAHTGYINRSDIDSTIQGQRLTGYAGVERLHVHSSTSRSSAVLRSYNEGHSLVFRTYNKQWYQATVFVNGVSHTGFINKSDIDSTVPGQRLTGFADVQQLNVHSATSRGSAVLRSYNEGHSLIFRTYNSQWYQATVFVNGVSHNGFIHVNDITFEEKNEPAAPTQPIIRGVAIADKVSVYSATSRTSTVLKSYNKGHILQYRTFNATWHVATVVVGGVARTGYIHSADIENVVTLQTAKSGVALKSSTPVYASTSTGASVLKSYAQGSILRYQTFTSEWYQATVVVNGKSRTGYIHRNDVEEITSAPTTINGIGIKAPTNVYTRASKSSQVRTAFGQNTAITYRTFTASWFQTTVWVNGVSRTGYIHKDDVAITNGKVVMLDAGHGGGDPGALGLYGLVEKTVVLDITLRTEQLLKNAGYTVLMTRSTDKFLTLGERSVLANNSNADIFVSIHANAFNGAARGIETFWYGKYERTNSIRLATLLQNNMVSSMGLSYRRVAEGNYSVIRETRVPSALVEVGFIDNSYDAQRLSQASFRQLAAQGIYNGIVDYFK